ncbi:glycerate 2-kinase [Bathymodiolus platifrons methanotrophic gill symbiont]|uniref:glycerate kinase type-2 family protein n=1 Tax=Bathymodiolus platifrons methanotrophic gill symbiont TaxID=113268 RepID=UPI001B7C0443|nr:DUF4147 domain-containing protein [Bathymodiolus platifrons methanotrophic gill symbiont]GFO76190.1 glycerate 2-kinase [Bathymodiolus platifrons methanotrophic gill symbiont]
MLADLRKDTQQIFQAGIKAADPYLAVKKYLQFDEGQLVCRLDLNDKAIVRKKQWQKIYLVAFGKAACTMIKAAQEIIPAQFLAGKAIAVTNYANVQKIENIDVIGAGHPLPNQDGQAGAQKIVEQVMLAQQGDLVLVLVSGGGSALMPAPVSAISLEEKIMTTELLLGSGATINEINCVRKHLSILKGGGLAKMIAPAAVQDYLKKGSSGQVSETPKSDDPCFNQVTHTLIGSNAISLQAIRQASASLGYDVFIYSEQLAGEAQKVAEELALYAKNVIDKGIDKPCAILAGGETTVTIQGTGQGGRNQEMALAFVIAAEKKYQLKAEWCFLSAGTDGRDGPTDAAGGLVDTNALERMHKAHIEAGLYLANNDSYHALQMSEDLLMTGATGTNVADLQILLIQPNTKISQPGDQNV